MPVTVAERLLDPLAWLSVITALVAVWIAFQQYQTSRANLRLELYEKRYAVYHGLIALLGHIMREGDVSLDAIRDFSLHSGEAVFLFDDGLVMYLENMRKEAVRLRSLNSRLHEEGLPIGPQRTATAEEESELLKWFEGQFEESKRLFGKYLRFKEAF